MANLSKGETIVDQLVGIWGTRTSKTTPVCE